MTSPKTPPNWIQIIMCAVAVSTFVSSVAVGILGLYFRASISPVYNRISLLELDRTYLREDIGEIKTEVKGMTSAIRLLTSSLDRFLSEKSQ